MLRFCCTFRYCNRQACRCSEADNLAFLARGNHAPRAQARRNGDQSVVNEKDQDSAQTRAEVVETVGFSRTRSGWRKRVFARTWRSVADGSYRLLPRGPLRPSTGSFYLLPVLTFMTAMCAKNDPRLLLNCLRNRPSSYSWTQPNQVFEAQMA